MNEAEAKENHFAQLLLCWVAGGPRSLRVECNAGAPWRLDVRDGPWSLQSEGETFAEAAAKLTRFSGGRFDEEEGEIR